MTAAHHDQSGALARYGFALEEVARRSGVDFTHEAPIFDARLDHIMPQVASMGAAVAVADFDRDGWQDFYVTNSAEGGLNRLYRNQGDGTFKNVAPDMDVAAVNRTGTGVSMGAIWADYDNDGYEDLFVYKYGRPELFHNEQGRSFTRVSERAGLPEWVNANSAVWLDYDRDGWLDLFVAGYWPEDVDLWHLDDHADHAGELRVREQRRPQVPVPQPGRRHVRGDVRGARDHLAPLDAGRRRRRSVRHRLPGSVPRQRLRHLPDLRQPGTASGSWTSARRPTSAARRRAG